MKLAKKVEDALNKQMNAEFYAAYLYLSMSAWLTSHGLEGMAKWYKKQSEEEVGHAMKIYSYIHERGGVVTLAPIEAGSTTFESPKAIMEAALVHEEKVTKVIYDLVDLATAEKDYASRGFLSWFIQEQVEEEANANALLDKWKLAHGCCCSDDCKCDSDDKNNKKEGDSCSCECGCTTGAGLYLFDKEMGKHAED
ncbi:MAG: ferritin [Prevotellaceae bacterium]|jgi:ferritin|nr:ferritin [Prevotellaceae bacterium]